MNCIRNVVASSWVQAARRTKRPWRVGTREPAVERKTMRESSTNASRHAGASQSWDDVAPAGMARIGDLKL
jgi:hypothetical protein